MKRIVSLVIVLGVLLCSAGCSQQDNAPEKTPTVPSPTPTVTSSIIIDSDDSNSKTGERIETVVGSLPEDIREDRCELYLQVLEDLWNVDSGLNDGIKQFGIDLSNLSHLNNAEKKKVMQDFSDKHDLPYLKGTWEELCEQGYIDKENLVWEDGLFFSIETIEDAVWNLYNIRAGEQPPELTAFNAHKWRSGLGAYFFGQCAAQKNADGRWAYTIGQEAVS
ncbi:MAG: hypothetical protein IJL39_05800 [Clostridia bacterium]|nr:hypothetical protein [Clostridia bacterium]